MGQFVALAGTSVLGACQSAPETIVVTPPPATGPTEQATPTAIRATTGPTAAPTTAVPTPTVAAAGAPTPQPAIPPSGAPATPVSTPAIARFRTIFEQHLGQHPSDWPDDPQATAWFAEGGYHLFARQPSRFVAVGAPIDQPLRDVAVMAMFRKVGGPPGGGYGLIVRDQGPGPRDGINQRGRYYVLEAGDRREVGIWRRDGDHWVDLLRWTPSAMVRPGREANQLTAQAFGSRLTFLINGVQVASLEDASLGEGAVGVFLGGDFNEALLEWLVVQVP